MNRVRRLAFYVDMVGVKARPFGEQTRMLEELTLLGQEYGVDVVVLNPGYIRTNQGWRYDKIKRLWRMGGEILPDIVIRRSGTFSSGLKRFIRQDLTFFSSRHLLHTLPLECSNKWKLNRTLYRDDLLRPHLPFTQFVSTPEQIYAIARQRKDVYVKPIAGAQGASVFRLRSESENVVRAIWERRLVSRDTERHSKFFQPRTEVLEQRIVGQEQLHEFWSKTKLQKCVVQDTVMLQQDEQGRPYDFRWLVQSSTAPKIMARVARVGQKNGVTTNIHTGGLAMWADQVFPTYTQVKKRIILTQMDEIACAVTRLLAIEFGHFAEIGIDLAVDTSDKIFVFEVNPTPGRRMLRSLSPAIREMSLRTLLEYASRATAPDG